jgi:2-methylcitrate dehydratase PrpD
VADPVFSKGYPNQRAAQVDIETVDGRKLSHFQPHRKGDPEQPLTDTELNGKFMELAEPVIGDKGAKRLLEQLWMLDKLPTAEFELLSGDVRASA